jgi:hypothetical protein
MNREIRGIPDYGNWTPKLVIYAPLALALLFVASSFIWSFLLIPAAFLLLCREGHLDILTFCPYTGSEDTCHVNHE